MKESEERENSTLVQMHFLAFIVVIAAKLFNLNSSPSQEVLSGF